MISYSPADPSTVNGYNYDETSQSWKDFCSDLPCDLLMQWPGYVSESIDVTIDGQPAVIQCWKGWCEDAVAKLPPLPPPFGDIQFPGGFGAEVGVYRRKPGIALPINMTPQLPPGWPPAFELAAKTWFAARELRFNLSGPGDFWWPANDLVVDSGAKVSFTLMDPVFREHLISGYSTGTYWTCQWMRPPSFALWCAKWHLQHPLVSPADWLKPSEVSGYILEFTVAGVDYVWDAKGMRVAP